MKTKFYQITGMVLGLFLFLAVPVMGQVPSDFNLVASVGGSNAFNETRSIVLGADGQLTYTRFIPINVGADPLESRTATMTQADLNALWASIQGQGFFTLNSQHQEDRAQDGTYVRLIVQANGQAHEVKSQNIAVGAFDTIMASLNTGLPADMELKYNTDPIVEYTPRDVCEQFNAGLKQILEPLGFKEGNPSPPSVYQTQNEEAHSGTVSSYKISLQDAVRRGIVTLEGKGGFFGDKVSISGDNTSNVTTEEVTVDLYIELWGTEANAANAQKIKSGIESKWSNKTATNGKKLKVVVHTRVNTTATSAPGTTGYHQVQLGNPSVSYVTGMGTDFKINEGTGGGNWETTAPDASTSLESIYAHEAGHLMGLDDKYDDYEKQADGKWKKVGETNSVTSAQLAQTLLPKYPGQTAANLTAWLSGAGMTRVTPPHDGEANNLMAALDGSPGQAEIDELVSKAGLTIEVKPGDILVNKNGSDQSLAITRTTSMFIKGGETKRLNGLYTACIDHDRGSPNFAQRFDVAPRLENWAGIRAAGVLMNLASFLDQQDLFCGNDFVVQDAIWRVTDNTSVGDVFVDELLQQAGINIGEDMLDFPRMENPASGDTTTAIVLPTQLVVARTSPTSQILTAGTSVTISATIEGPSLEGFLVAYNWTLVAPEGSSVSITNPAAESVTITPDVRGTYLISPNVMVTDPQGASFAPTQFTSRLVVPDASTDTFERNTLRDGIFLWRTTGDARWSLSTTYPSSGDKSVSSGAINDGESSVLQMSVRLPAEANLFFSYRVSSEEGFDHFEFEIDGEMKGQWSGQTDWSIAQFSIPAGDHTLTWRYVKDSSVSSGLDRAWIDDVFFPPNAVLTAREDEPALPYTYRLEQNYPNPFNPSTTISYVVAGTERVTLTVYDALGREVARLVDKTQAPGSYNVLFETDGLPSGVYTYTLEAGEFVRTMKMILLR